MLVKYLVRQEVERRVLPDAYGKTRSVAIIDTLAHCVVDTSHIVIPQELKVSCGNAGYSIEKNYI